MDETQQRFEELFDEIGEKCLSKLAAHLGIEYYTIPDLENCICGMYVMPNPNDEPVIILNGKKELDSLESVFYQLITHHLEHQGIPYVLTEAEMKRKSRRHKIPAFFELKAAMRSVLKGAL